jgi:hypothetical protein
MHGYRQEISHITPFTLSKGSESHFTTFKQMAEKGMTRSLVADGVSGGVS